MRNTQGTRPDPEHWRVGGRSRDPGFLGVPIHDTLVLRLARFFPGAFPASLPLQYSQKPRRFLCHSRGRKPSEEETEHFPGNRISASGFAEVVDGIHTSPDSLGSKQMSNYPGLPSS